MASVNALQTFSSGKVDLSAEIATLAQVVKEHEERQHTLRQSLREEESVVDTLKTKLDGYSKVFAYAQCVSRSEVW